MSPGSCAAPAASSSSASASGRNSIGRSLFRHNSVFHHKDTKDTQNRSLKDLYLCVLGVLRGGKQYPGDSVHQLQQQRLRALVAWRDLEGGERFLFRFGFPAGL